MMNLPSLDPRFGVLFDRMNQAVASDARAGLRRHAEVIAAGCHRSFAGAEAELLAMRAPPPPKSVPEAAREQPTPAVNGVIVNDTHAGAHARARDAGGFVTTACSRATKPPSPVLLQRAALTASIEGALRNDHCRADRAIAREIGCSQVTVGKVRKRLGLAVSA